MFKRVREAVVRDTAPAAGAVGAARRCTASLRSCPASTPSTRQPADADGSAETAFWNSIQASNARRRLPRLPAPVPARAASPSAPRARAIAALSRRPRAGGRAPRRHAAAPRTDAARRRHLALPRARTSSASATCSSPRGSTRSPPTASPRPGPPPSDAKVRTTRVALEPGFNPLPDWTPTPPEFAPYLQAAGLHARPAQPADQRAPRRAVSVPLKAQRRRRGRAWWWRPGAFAPSSWCCRGGPAPAPARAITTEHRVWYAPDVRRIVRYEVVSHSGRTVREATVFELTEYKLQ